MYILKELNRLLRDVAGGGKISSQKTVLTFSGIIVLIMFLTTILHINDISTSPDA